MEDWEVGGGRCGGGKQNKEKLGLKEKYPKLGYISYNSYESIVKVVSSI